MDFVADWRRDQRRERWLSRGALLGTIAFIGLYFAFAIGLRRTQAEYLAFNLFALVCSLSRLVAYKRYELPAFLPALRDPDPAVRAAATRAFDALRGEILPVLFRAAYVRPGQMDERTRAATAEDAAETYAKLGRSNWKIIARIWFVTWFVLFLFMIWLATAWTPPP